MRPRSSQEVIGAPPKSEHHARAEMQGTEPGESHGAGPTPSAPPTLPPELRPAPPTTPGPLSFPTRPPSWPSVFGILSIVLGAMAIIQGAYGVIAVLFMPGLFGLIPGSGVPMRAAMSQNMPFNIGVQIATSLLGIVNLLAGVWLVQRLPRGVPWLRTWAVLKVFFTLLSAMAGYYVQAGMMTAVQQGSPAPGPPAGILSIFAWLGVALAVMWGWAYPVTALIWLARPAVRAHVREWDHAAPAGAVNSEP